MRSPPDQIRNAIVDWVNDLNWRETITITLTFPPKIAAVKAAVEHNARYFWNVVDGEVFGKRSKNQKRPFRCQRTMFIESGANHKNHHYHGVVSVSHNPYARVKYQTIKGMKKLLEDVWSDRMAFNANRMNSPVKVEPLRAKTLPDSRWVEYMTKKINSGNTDIFCLETSWLTDGRYER